MSLRETIRVEGVVVEVVGGVVCRVELPNKHRVVAHMSSEARLRFTGLSAGERVVVMMSPYDLSQGTIIGKSQTNL